MKLIPKRQKLILYRQLLRRTEYMTVDKKVFAVTKIKEGFRNNKLEKDQKKINYLIDEARSWMIRLEKMLKQRLEMQKIKSHHRNVLEMYNKSSYKTTNLKF